MSARDHWGHPKLTNQEILQKSNTTKRRTQNVIVNWGESETIAILRSSDSRGRHPRRAPPWIGHAIRHVCEWTHWKWMAGLCWGARFISSDKNAPTRAPPSPPGGRGLESSWRIACAGEWVDELCVHGCARDWLCASPSKNACRDGGKKKHKCNTWREAKLMQAKASGTKFCLWMRLILPEKEDEHGRNVFVLNY